MQNNSIYIGLSYPYFFQAKRENKQTNGKYRNEQHTFASLFLFLQSPLKIADSIRNSIIHGKMHARTRKTKSPVKFLQAQQRYSKREKLLKSHLEKH